MSRPSLNIVLFGETGVGKSSLINLIAGRQVAETSPDVQGCTMSFKAHNVELQGRNFVIWDTVGLEEPEIGVNGYLAAVEQACDLIHHIIRQGGVDLLLFCIRGTRVTATTQSNYRLFFEAFCRCSVPIAAVVTHLEKEPKMEGWWERNVESIGKYGMKFAGHACVTGLPKHYRYQESRSNVVRLLEGRTADGRFNMPAESWLIEFLHIFGLYIPLRKDAKRPEVLKYLMTKCKLDRKIADQIADRLEGYSSSWVPSESDKRVAVRDLTEEVMGATPNAIGRNTFQYCLEGDIHRKVAVKFVIGLNKQKKYRVDLKLRVRLIDKTIVPVLGVVDKPLPGIVTQWYPHGSLSDYLSQHKSLSLEDKKAMLDDVAVGLRYLHNQNVVHGNLHSNNILIDTDKTCRLTDLAFTLPDKFIGASWLGSLISYDSLRFADPKLVTWAQKAPDQIISPSEQCDIYSFGGVILHVMFGTKPYGDLGRLEILEKLLHEEPSDIPSQTSQVPPAYESLIRRCWNSDEAMRPLAKDFIEQNWFSRR